MSHFINQTQTTVNHNHTNNVNNFVDNLLQSDVTYCNTSKKSFFTPVSNSVNTPQKPSSIIEMYRFTKSQTRILEEMLHHTNYKTSQIFMTREGLAAKLGVNRKTVQRAYKLFIKLGILASEGQSRGAYGTWGYAEDRLELSHPTVGHFLSHTFPTGINKNKKKIINDSEVNKVFVQPSPLEADFDFTAEEKQLTKERYQVSDLDIEESIEESIMDWKSYNLHRVGYNWFSSYERFCENRVWPRRIEQRRSFPVHANTQPKNNYKAFSNAPCRVGEVGQKYQNPSVCKNITKKAVKVAWHKPKLKKLPAISVAERESLINELMDCTSYSHLRYQDRLRFVNSEIERSYEN
jgi:DNA-binding transcriptional regulator YhcF (GntR family)